MEAGKEAKRFLTRVEMVMARYRGSQRKVRNLPKSNDERVIVIHQ